MMTSILVCLPVFFHKKNLRGYIKLLKIQVGLKLCKKSFFNSKCKRFGSQLICHMEKELLEEGIDYEEVFASVARIEAIRLFLAYASFMGFMVYQMDVKSAFLYGTIEEEVYVCQPLRFEDPDHPNKKKKDGIFISHDKYVVEILRKSRLSEGKSASTPIDIEKPLLKDPDGEDVDVHTYRSMIGPLMYLTSSRPDFVFEVYACARFQVTPKASHLHAVKRIFIYLKGKPHLGLWYTKDSSFDLVAYSDSDYAGASLDRKSTTAGVNTPICDEDTLELMELMVFLLPKVEKDGIGVSAVDLQVSAVRLLLLLLVQKFLLFGMTNWCCSLSAVRSIKYALTVNPNIYMSCIKQFWTTVVVKKVNDVIRLQALADKKNVVITKATIRDALRLDDAEGVECLPNEEIFVELAKIGYEKPSTKLTFYKEFFSRKQVGDLSTHTTKYTSPAITQKVFANMRRVDADENDENINADDTAEGDVSAAHGEVPTDVGLPMNLLQEVMDTCTALTRRVKNLKLDKIAQALEITKLKRKVKKLERINKGRMIAEMDQDADVVLEEAKEVVEDAKVDESVDIQGRKA
nr:hypothetical protein [Tanacetum cinerariifolium]